MTTINYTEIFYSVQGEGRFVGVPSVFIRTFGCNFKCNSFGCDTPVIGHNPEVIQIIKDIDNYDQFTNLPLASTGCDSYSSVYPEFKRFAKKETIDEIAHAMTSLLPYGPRWKLPNGNNVHLILTGGEPLLGWQKAYPELLQNDKMYDLTNITIETNGTQKLHKEFEQYMKFWGSYATREITFSVSPKLSASGESWEDAINPQIVCSYENVGTTYLKFVIGNANDFAEVDRAVAEYRAAGFTGVIYIMPIGGVTTVYDNNKFNIADECLARGYYYSPRLQVDLWGNKWAK